jgi:hypothetical protein
MSGTNSRFVQDLNRIVRLRQANKGEIKKVQAEPIGAVRGIGETNTPPKIQSGGIASPLKEIPGTRIYFEPELLTSSDGLFVIEQKAIKQAVYEDANGEQVVIEFINNKDN